MTLWKLLLLLLFGPHEENNLEIIQNHPFNKMNKYFKLRQQLCFVMSACDRRLLPVEDLVVSLITEPQKYLESDTKSGINSLDYKK